MSDKKPLHVRVAEALGCKLVKRESVLAASGLPGTKGDFYWACACKDNGYRPGPHGSRLSGVYDYDTDWSATGPLIERFGITLSYGYYGWRAQKDTCERDNGQGLPLVAVCNLILALAEAGKLPA